MSSTGHHDSHTPEEIRQLWQTPKWFFDYWNRHYDFAVDIAASESNHLCSDFITAEQNALDYDFSSYVGEYVWCNPPYREIGPWVDLFCKNADEHRVGTVALLPADISTSWFKAASTTADEIIFITGGRLSFVRADTQQPIGGNTKGSVILIYNPAKKYNDGESVSTQVSFLERNNIKAIMEGYYGQNT